MANIPDAETQSEWNDKADSMTVDAHIENEDLHVTAAQKAAWDSAASGADLAALQTDVQSALADEASARSAADTNLQSQLSAEVSARQSAISAEQSARAAAISSAVSAETSARQAADAALEQQIALCGNCKIVTGSYTGDGTASKTRTLNFNGKPLLVLIKPKDGSIDRLSYLLINGMTTDVSKYQTSSSSASVTWDSTSVTITTSHASYGMNSSGTEYRYLALLEM